MSNMVLELDKIVEKRNGRSHADEAAITEMAQSMVAHGVLEPLIVREVQIPLPGSVDPDHIFRSEYHLVSGHRRLAAARVAHLPTVPVIVKLLTDEEVEEIQLIENSQRVNINPMDEALAYQRLIEGMSLHHADVAARVGKSLGYVRGRLKLCALPTAMQKAVRDGRIEVAVGILVARIPDKEVRGKAAAMILEWATPGGDPVREADARAMIESEFMLELRTAPFDTADMNLVPATGSCGACPKRTGNDPDLFGDISDRDTCTDPRCFAAKKDASWRALEARAKETGQKVLDGAAAKRLFPYGDDRVTASGDYVKLDDETTEYGKPRTWRGLIGEHLSDPPVLVRAPNGAAVELVPKAALKEAAKRAGLKPRAQAIGSVAEVQDKEKELATAHRKHRAALDACASAVVDAYLARPASGDGLLVEILATQAILHGNAEGLRDTAKRRGMKVPEDKTLFDAWKAWMAGLGKESTGYKSNHLGAFLLELAITQGARHAATGEYPEAMKQAAKLLKVDLEKVPTARGVARLPKHGEPVDQVARRLARDEKPKKGVCRKCQWTGDPKTKPQRMWANKDHTMCTECSPGLAVPVVKVPDGPPRKAARKANLRPRKKAAPKKGRR